MQQLWNLVATRPSTVVTITLVVAGVALAIATAHGVHRPPRFGTWDRRWAVLLPAAVATTLLASAAAAGLRGTPFAVATFVRTAALWATIVVAPLAVGQVVGLRPPTWLGQATGSLAAVHLVLFWFPGPVFTHPASADPATQYGPFATPLLLPAAALTGWWLLNTLPRAPTSTTTWLLALGGSTTSLALLVGALRLQPALADHLLDVAFLPTLLAAEVIVLQTLLSQRTAPTD